jgi:hypothetical protein
MMFLVQNPWKLPYRSTFLAAFDIDSTTLRKDWFVWRSLLPLNPIEDNAKTIVAKGQNRAL